MKLFLIVPFILGTTFANNLVASDQVEKVFLKFMKNELLTSEEHKLQEDIFEVLRRPNYLTSTDEYQPEVRLVLDCLICRSAFSALFDLVEIGSTDEQLTGALVNICFILGMQSYNVCNGAVSLNLHIITYIIRNTPEATPANFCGLILQQAKNVNFCPYNDSRFEWQVNLPDKLPPNEFPYTNDSSLTIAVLTDAHIDPLYEAFGVAECGEPTCCRKGQTLNFVDTYEHVDIPDIDRSVIIAGENILLNLNFVTKIREMRGKRRKIKIPKNAKPAGYWGDYRNCDTPPWAYDDLIERIASAHKFDAVYYIGDTIDHGIWETTYETINAKHLYLIEKMRKTFGDNVIIVPAIGNHESQPTNQFAPPNITEPTLNTTWLYEALAQKWDYYLTNEAKQSLKVRGDFSILIRPGLRVISLNTNTAYKFNWWLVYDPLEPKQHLDWLVDELRKAELAGEKVHILTHIPAGVHDLAYVWTREYNRIVNRFSSTIAAEFNGHVHADEFKIFYSLSDPSNPINVGWGAGSATAYTNYNLNYKIVKFNTSTYEPRRISNYIYNLTEANLTPNRRPHWFQLYDFNNSFGINDLSPKSMDNLVHQMVTNNTHLLELYSAFFSKLSDRRWPYCNNDCKLDNLCKTVTTVLWKREKCEELRRAFHLNNNI